MKKIIITGATSFIGISLIEQLINEEHKIYAIIRPDSEKRNLIPRSDKIEVFEIPMNEYSKINKHITEPCDIFISLAWDGTRGESRNNKEMQKNNYKNSIDALKSAFELGCKKVINAGSQAEYGNHNCLIYEEIDEKPLTEYGKYKLKYCNYARKLCDANNINFIEARIFSLYGPYDYKNSMIMSALSKMVSDDSCNLTSCEQIWDYLYIEDAISAFRIFIEKDCDSGVYNLANGNHRKLKEFIIDMKRITNSNSELNFGAVSNKDNVNLIPDISKISKLGFISKTSFDEGILKILGCENFNEKN